MLCFFGHEAYGILVPQPGVTHGPLALEGKVLTTRPPGKSLYYNLTEIILKQKSFFSSYVVVFLDNHCGSQRAKVLVCREGW